MAASERLICASADLVEGSTGCRFEVEQEGIRQSAFAIRHAGQVYAYLNRCGHIPMELDWNAGQFFDDSRLYLICSTHGALYAPDTGACLGGRCKGKGLEPVAVFECDGKVYVTEKGC